MLCFKDEGTITPQCAVTRVRPLLLQYHWDTLSLIDDDDKNDHIACSILMLFCSFFLLLFLCIAAAATRHGASSARRSRHSSSSSRWGWNMMQAFCSFIRMSDDYFIPSSFLSFFSFLHSLFSPIVAESHLGDQQNSLTTRMRKMTVFRDDGFQNYSVLWKK